MHTLIDERSAGEQDATPNAMLAVNQYAVASLNVFMSPAGTFYHLLYGKWLRVGGGQVQQLDMLPGHGLFIVGILRARIYYVCDAGAGQGSDILRVNTPTNGKFIRHPRHI